METFGQRLHTAMVVACKSGAGVAKHCRVSPETVDKWLRMERAELSGVHLESLCALLKCRMRWLITGTGPPEVVLPEPEMTDILKIALELSPELRNAWLGLGAFLAQPWQ